MKVNLTLEVSDDLRRLMGTAPECKKTRDGLATRDEVIRLLRSKLAAYEMLVDGFVVPTLMSEAEKGDYSDSVVYLKAAGWSDSEVKRWIFKQRARRDQLNTMLR